MIRKILCPTDLSANSKVGIAYAISAAREREAELVIFHATSFPVEPLVHDYEVNLFLERNLIPKFTVDQVLRQATSKLGYFVQGNFGNKVSGLKWKLAVGLGKVAKEIVTAACQEEADLIVMARRKRGMLGRLLSRSISEAVSREAPCPVLSICPPQIVRSWRGRRVPLIGGVMQGSEA